LEKGSAAGGDIVDQFLEQYFSVTRELAIAAIEEARRRKQAGLENRRANS
jgi:hypothetical protein